jgi:2-oxoglutarate/2-oxoacid ferredoxin oxidoreductase subunit beta
MDVKLQGFPEIKTEHHPDDAYLREDRFPHIWCPGCGIGICGKAYIEALKLCKIPLNRQVIVSGIGCTGRVAGYVNLDSYHTTHGRAIPFASGMKLANPDLEITVFSGDGDLFSIGGNHFIHAARRNVSINVICCNNFNYGMTGGQVGPTTPEGAFTLTSPFGNVEAGFNLPYVAAAAGAVFVARWTTLHFRNLRDAILRAFRKRGFTFIEVVSPCPTAFGRRNEFPDGLDEMEWYRNNSVIDHQAELVGIGIAMKKDSKIVVGNFVDIERPTSMDLYQQVLQRARGEQR